LIGLLREFDTRRDHPCFDPERDQGRAQFMLFHRKLFRNDFVAVVVDYDRNIRSDCQQNERLRRCDDPSTVSAK